MEILPSLWIISVNCSTSFILDKQISIIVNCANNKAGGNIYNVKEVEVLDFPIEFNHKNLVKENFDIIVNYIHDNLMTNLLINKSVAISYGRDTSSAISVLTVYLIKYGGMNKEVATKLIKDKLLGS